MNVRFQDRRAEIPVPLVQFLLDLSLAETLMLTIKLGMLTAAVNGKLEDWVESVERWVTNKAIPFLIHYYESKTDAAIDKNNEWIVFTLNAQPFGGPIIKLVIPSKHGSGIPSDAIPKFAGKVCHFEDFLSEADEIVFQYHPESEECEFRFALTKSGGVIASETCLNDTAPLHAMYLGIKESGTRFWGILVCDGVGNVFIRLYMLGGYEPRFLGNLEVKPGAADLLVEEYGVNSGKMFPLHFSEREEEKSEEVPENDK